MAEVKEQAHKPTPYDFFKSTSHELVTQDSAFQLIKPGKSLDEILCKTVFYDSEDVNRVAQCIGKLNECELGESSEPPYDSAMDTVKIILLARASIKGRSRAEFMQGLSRLFAPQYYQLLETGKISSDVHVKKQGGIFKGKEQKPTEEQV